MGLLGFERASSTLAQQIGFAQGLAAVVREAVATGAVRDAVVREAAGAVVGGAAGDAVERVADAGGRGRGRERDIGRGAECGQAAVGAVASAARGAGRAGAGRGGCRRAGGLVARAPYELDEAQRLHLFTRADTLYGGSDEVQRNIIAERVLGLPREARGPR